MESSNEFMTLRPKRKRVSSNIDFSPMADMVFQLLAFFIMTVKLANQDNTDLPAITKGDGQDVKQATIITIKQPSDTIAESQIFVGAAEGSPLTIENVEEAVRSLGKSEIVIKAERLVPAGLVIRVARAAKKGNENAILQVGVTDQQ